MTTTIQLVLGYFHDTVPYRRLITYSIGTSIHIVWLLLFLRYTYRTFQFNSFVTMISFMTFIFMKSEDFPIHETEQVRNLITLFSTTMVCVVYFNSNWLITTMGIITNMWVGFTFYV